MTPRTGRPPTGNARGKVLAVRLSDDESALIATAADLDGKAPSELVRESAVEYSKRRIKRAK